MTIREFFEYGAAGEFARQLLRTYFDPCPGNFRLLRGVAEGRNSLLIDEAVASARHYPPENRLRRPMLRGGLELCFPMLTELDREMIEDDYRRLPREAAKGGE